MRDQTYSARATVFGNDVQGVFWVQWGFRSRCLRGLAMNVFAQAPIVDITACESGPQLAWAMLWFDKRSNSTPT